jgi:hypothetical protein
LFGFGRRKGDVDIDETAIEQRVQQALDRLKTGGEPGLGVITESGTPPLQAPNASEDELDYVMSALAAEGFSVERAAVARILVLGRTFAAQSQSPGAAS